MVYGVGEGESMAADVPRMEIQFLTFDTVCGWKDTQLFLTQLRTEAQFLADMSSGSARAALDQLAAACTATMRYGAAQADPGPALAFHRPNAEASHHE